MTRLTLAILVALTGASYACPAPLLTDVPLTKDGTAIPEGGGVVMMTVNGRGGGDDDFGRNGGRLVVGTTNIGLRTDYLAPGLTVLVPKPQANRAIELVNGRGKAILELTQTGVAPKHAAPRLVAVTSTVPPEKPSKAPPRALMYEPAGEMTIELGDAPPEGVLALVLFETEQGVAWMPPVKGQTAYKWYVGGKRCMPGPGAVAQGKKVNVGWVDATGRISVLSKGIRVAAPRPARPNEK
jgi:hypothetical protein